MTRTSSSSWPVMVSVFGLPVNVELTRQLWDVAEDQDAVNLIRGVADPQEASKRLLDHAMTNYSTDNLSVMVIRFYH